MENKYPIGGYAPGNYQCHCSTCGGGFIGDKRAVQCEPCALRDMEKFDALSPVEQKELIKRNAQLVNEMFSRNLTPGQIKEREEAIKLYRGGGDKSQCIREYKQYKDNLKYLGGPTEWTWEKINSMSKMEIYQAIHGFNDLITFFDNVLYAYEEGASQWEERCLEAERKTGLVWVKATTWPEDHNMVHWRRASDKKPLLIIGRNYQGNIIAQFGRVYTPEELEWLDENPNP